MTCKVTVSSTDNLHVPLVLCLILTHSYSSIFSAVLIGIETLDDDEDSDWLGEYQRGCDWEIYTTELSRCLIVLVRCSMTFPLITQAMSIISFSFLNSTFEGSTFCALSEILYQKLGIVLFALEIEDLKKDKSSTRLLLNPAGEFSLFCILFLLMFFFCVGLIEVVHIWWSRYILFLNIAFALWYSSDFVIPPKEDFRIEAFVMAKNKAQVCMALSFFAFEFC